MDPVVIKIGQQRLVNVEDPDVLPVTGDLDRMRERDGLPGGNFRVRGVPVAVHVALDEAKALLRDQLPWAGVVRLHRQPPAVAEATAVFFFLAARGVSQDLTGLFKDGTEEGLAIGSGDEEG